MKRRLNEWRIYEWNSLDRLAIVSMFALVSVTLWAISHSLG